MKIGKILDIDINRFSFYYNKTRYLEIQYRRSSILGDIYVRFHGLLYNSIQNSLIENENR